MIKKTLTENKHKENRPRFLPIAPFVLVLALGLPLALLTAFWGAFRGRIYPRVSVCQIALVGKTQKEAQTGLEKALGDRTPVKINLLYKGKTYPLDSSSLEFLPAVSSQKALGIGRNKSVLESLKQLFSAGQKGKDLPFNFKLDETKLDAEIATISSKLYLPAIEPEIRVVKNGNQKTISVSLGENGQEVDAKSLKLSLLGSLACPQKEINLDIPVSSVSPQVAPATAEETKKRAVSFLDKSIKLKLDDQEWTINDEEMISFLSFKGGFDRQKIASFAQNLAKTIDSPPENAAFRFENNRVSVFRPSKDGLELQEDRLIDDLQKVLSLQESKEGNQELAIPVTKTPAKISIAEVNSLGINELLGKGTSLFFGSISERIHNINLASLRLSGILVGPGETFSFNKNLGDVSADTGFKQAYIIKEGRTVLGDGGGVCQVSTTLFRAALNAGLPITERHAHAYRVHYYEDDLGPGLDATVFDPTADLKIKNDTPAYLLIQSSIDIKNRKLTFEIYGTNDGRKVSISKVRVWDKVAPLPDLYQDDPTLPAGTIKQVDWKAWGAKAAFDYKVIRNGETLTEKTFTSYYRPWQAVYLRGTGQ